MAFAMDSMMMVAQKMRHISAVSKTTTTKTKTTKTGR
ncbi:hypothetical protein DFP90_106119 [Aestuariispira insulae]|uniref:Uncharacterized protein n=1 Tax=Aestuariispira insulae TaxID=1461337 RepID=A0A3D9HHX8_9PROT|nr:hypothetical protein DFP90_106119 [Aestuariispira insulae]